MKDRHGSVGGRGSALTLLGCALCFVDRDGILRYSEPVSELAGTPDEDA